MANDDGSDNTLEQSEGLDSDEVRNEDGDDVVTPPDHWSEANSFGTTAEEALEGESLDQKLAEEEPDVPLEDEPDVPVAALADSELTEELVDHVIDEDVDYDDSVSGDRESTVVDGTVTMDCGVHRGQIDGSSDGGSEVQ